MVAAESVFTAH